MIRKLENGNYEIDRRTLLIFIKNNKMLADIADLMLVLDAYEEDAIDELTKIDTK